jgi:hypothetical protein
MVGAQRSSVSVVTRTLQNAGLITQSRGAITVTDRSGLEDAACECYGVVRRSFERLLPHTDERESPHKGEILASTRKRTSATGVR